MRSRGTWFGVGVLLVSLWGPAVAAAEPTQSAQPATTGRVVATITTLEGTVHMPGIQIELRDPDERIVIAKTETDGAGQVTFPDVPDRPLPHHGIRTGLRGPRFHGVRRARERDGAGDSRRAVDVCSAGRPGARRHAVTHGQCPTSVDERHAVGIAVRDRAARGRRFPEPVAAVAGGRPGWRTGDCASRAGSLPRARCRSAAPA